ncbi:MAG: phage portal protein [Phycisphaerales bacterium]
MPDRLERKNADADPVWGNANLAIGEHRRRELPGMERLWAYYRNPLELVGVSGHAMSVLTTGQAVGWYRQAQEAGLPVRIKGRGYGVPGSENGRREVVIENDIGWRIQTMVDFMFGRPVRFESLASDEATRSTIEDLLERVWEASGGISLMQDAALLGHVFGHVDLLLRVDESKLFGDLEEAVRGFSVEPIDPRRGVPMVSPEDYRVLDGYAVHAEREVREARPSPNRSARRTRLFGGARESEPAMHRATVTEVYLAGERRVYQNGALISSEPSSVLADQVPVVHVQNVSQPFVYSGVGEVEPLVALQDELNTRLSDRANRVTLQSFRMYLAKGVESFDASSVGPGMVWSTNNPDASISAFGGDLYNPGEEYHIGEVREAMDKISGVPPVAGGVVRAKIGNLSSANALRITLMGLIAKTERKRVSYGRGMERIGSLILRALDESGVVSIPESERGVRVVWPAFVFEDEGDRLDVAARKRELGVDETRVLGELGYDERDPGVV